MRPRSFKLRDAVVGNYYVNLAMAWKPGLRVSGDADVGQDKVNSEMHLEELIL